MVSKQERNYKEEAKSGEQNEENAFFTNEEDLSEVWYLDSGCSSHMTGNKNVFYCLMIDGKSKVVLGDGKSKTIEGRGNII